MIPYPVGNQPPVPLLPNKTSSIKSNQPVPSVQQKPVASNQQTSVTMPTEVSKSSESVQQNEIPEENLSAVRFCFIYEYTANSLFFVGTHFLGLRKPCIFFDI